MNLLTMSPRFLMSMPGGSEWIWILLAVIVLFGGKKIPELAKGIGKGIRDFNEAKDTPSKTPEDAPAKEDTQKTIV